MLKRALLLICLALLAVGVGAEEMTVDQVVEKHIEAQGGRDAWEGVSSAKISGKIVMGGTMEMPVTIYFQRPGKVRMEMEMQGQQIVQAFDGKEGWQIMPMMGSPDPQRMNEYESKMVKRQSEFEGPLYNYKDKGHSVELLGKEDVEGTEAYKLKITLNTGDEIYSYLDTEHFLEFMQTGKTMTQTGQEVQSTIMVGDYKEVGSLMLPHSREIIPEGAPQGVVISFDSIDLNSADINDEIFAMPEAPAAAEAGTR